MGIQHSKWVCVFCAVVLLFTFIYIENCWSSLLSMDFFHWAHQKCLVLVLLELNETRTPLSWRTASFKTKYWSTASKIAAASSQTNVKLALTHLDQPLHCGVSKHDFNMSIVCRSTNSFSFVSNFAFPADMFLHNSQANTRLCTAYTPHSFAVQTAKLCAESWVVCSGTT